jgi:hypothetical protein
LRRPRRSPFIPGLVVSPLVSGGFFGFVAAVLTLRSGTHGQALAVGALVGGVMFAVNAVALCVAHSIARTEIRPRSES